MATSAAETCRLVLAVTGDLPGQDLPERLAAALGAGEVAAIIVDPGTVDEEQAQRFLESAVSAAAPFGVPVIGVTEPRIVARAGAHGIHVRGSGRQVADAVGEYQERMMVGTSAGDTRDQALSVGEARPDYVFFGKIGGDTHSEAHPKVVAMAAWWAEFIEVPAILMGGNDMATLDMAAASGVEFVALSRAVLGAGVDPARAVRSANEILARHVLPEAA